jgi:hypothetical protein
MVDANIIPHDCLSMSTWNDMVELLADGCVKTEVFGVELPPNVSKGELGPTICILSS